MHSFLCKFYLGFCVITWFHLHYVYWVISWKKLYAFCWFLFVKNGASVSMHSGIVNLLLSVESNNVVWLTDCWKHCTSEYFNAMNIAWYVLWQFTTLWCETFVSLKICSNQHEHCAFDMLCCESWFRRFYYLS